MTLLVRHPETPPGAVQAIDAELQRVPGGVKATFRVAGDIARLLIPPPATPQRTGGLWHHTCFELFVGDEDGRYREFNLSPSGAWAAFQFGGYRSGMSEAVARIDVDFTSNDKSLSLVAKIECEFRNPAHVGLTAVMEERDGILRYWSTAFAPGKPDFHAPEVRSLLLDGVGTE